MLRANLLPINSLNNFYNFPNERDLSPFHGAKDLRNTSREPMSNYEATLNRALKKFDYTKSSKHLCLSGAKDLKNLAKSIAKQSVLKADASKTESQISAYSGYVARVSPHCNFQYDLNLQNDVITTPQQAVKEATINNRKVRLKNKIQHYGELRNKLVDHNNRLYTDLSTFSNNALPRNPVYYHHRKTVDPSMPRNHLARDDLACRHNLASLDAFAAKLPYVFANTRETIVSNCENLEIINQKLIELTAKDLN